MSLVYYDASTDTVYTMNAEWNTVLAETNPMSIPGGVDLSDPERGMLGRDPSGRTALVGGFMKGVGALGTRASRPHPASREAAKMHRHPCARIDLFAALDSLPNRVKHLPKHAGRRVVQNPSREHAARVTEHLIHNDGALRGERNQGPRTGAGPDVAGAFNVGPASSPAGTRAGGEGLGLDP